MQICTSCFTKGHTKLGHIGEKRHCETCSQFTWCYQAAKKQEPKAPQEKNSERGLYLWLREPHATNHQQ